MIIVFDAQNQWVHVVVKPAPLKEIIAQYPGMYPIDTRGHDLALDYEGEEVRLPQLADQQDPSFASTTRLVWSRDNQRWELGRDGRDYWTARYNRGENTQEGYTEILSSAARISSREEARQLAHTETQGATTAEALDAIRDFIGDIWWLSASVGRNSDTDNDAIFIPDVDQVSIAWKQFTDSWPGWGFHATFNRADITALGLKVYSHSGTYLYALTFQQTDEPNIVKTETPAGFRFPAKTDGWQFEVIAGSAPVSDRAALTPADERIFINVDF